MIGAIAPTAPNLTLSLNIALWKQGGKQLLKVCRVLSGNLNNRGKKYNFDDCFAVSHSKLVVKFLHPMIGFTQRHSIECFVMVMGFCLI